VTFTVLGHDDVVALLPMVDCIGVMRQALTALARGAGLQPLRSLTRPADLPGFMVLMPGYVPAAMGAPGASGALGVKVLGIFPGNPAVGQDPHQGVVLLLSPESGELTAVLDASALTGIRTAAVSAVATDTLARPDASRLAIVGAGVQARWHIPAIAAVRPLDDVVVVARDLDRVSAFAREAADAFNLPVRAADDVGGAVRGADIVVTATSAVQPVLRREWLADGVHVNAVGACVPTARELDTDTVASGLFYVDRRESALAEAGDLVLAGLGAGHIVGELGEVLTGAAPGRLNDTDITIFESLGLAVEDLAAAAFTVQRATATGRGAVVGF
jgi:ornithine cyclodeaminase